MRSDINQYIKQYHHCQLTFCYRRRDQKIILSWPLYTPFVILHVDLWMPVKYTDIKDNMALMNAMCDMSQFVVVVPVTDEYSSTLADYCFQHMLMKFGLCHLVVLDDGIPFKGTFVVR